MKRTTLLQWAKSNNPTLLEEWDYEKNENIKPDEVTAFSHKRVWWKCAEGHLQFQEKGKYQKQSYVLRQKLFSIL